MVFPLLPAAAGVGFSLSSLVNAATSLFHRGRQEEAQRESQLENQRFQLERDRRAEEFALSKAKLDYAIQFGRDEQNRHFQQEQAALSREHQSREAALQRFFQAQENQLNRESQRQLTEYVQNREDLRQKDRQQHDRIMQADRQHHELEMQKNGQAFVLYQMYLQMQEKRQSEEYNRVMSRHPLLLTPTTILEWYEAYQEGDRPLPPLVIVSPPTLSFDRYNSNSSTSYLGEMSKSLEEEVRVFFETYGKSAQHPVRYISRLWDTKVMAADTAASHLHSLFKTIPTVVLELETEGALFNFRRFSWDMGDTHYQSSTILSQFSLEKLVFQIQKDLANLWNQEKNLLQAAGVNVEALIAVENSEEAIDEYNLNILLTETKLRQANSQRTLPYRVSRKGIDRLKQYLRCLTCLVAGLAIDDYHLSRYGTTPQLPRLMGSFLKDLPELEARSLLDHLVQHYQGLITAMREAGSWRMPDIAIEMAEQLSQIPIATQQAIALLDLSISCWLAQRKIEPGMNPLESITSALSIADQDYVSKLNAALKNLGKTQQLDIVMSCYCRGLQHLETCEYGAARADFDQVISLNPHAEAYYQRALANFHLETYADAIKDFNQSLILKLDTPEVYRWRGETHYHLGNYRAALDDFRIAADRGVKEAETRWHIAQGVWVDVQRRQAEEAERQKRAQEQAERQQKAQENFNRGQNHYQQGQYDQAIANFEQAQYYGHAGALQKIQEVQAEIERRKNLIYRLPNGGGDLEFIEVPAGTLEMAGGHKVTFKASYRISKYPITQRQYQAIMGNNPSHFQGDDLTPKEKKKGLTHLDRPVEQVTWHEAKAFCDQLSGQDYMGKQTVSLPSETQWEWAARGATKSKGYTFAGSNTLKKVGWFDGNAENRTHPVGQLQGNELEIHDMSGNVWEWCMDNWSSNADVLPRNGTALTQGRNSDLRAVRGGAWLNVSGFCASAFRYYLNPDLRSDFRGFRVVLP